ncbi:unnamed protein product [Chrysoparadoxa australica]
MASSLLQRFPSASLLLPSIGSSDADAERAMYIPAALTLDCAALEVTSLEDEDEAPLSAVERKAFFDDLVDGDGTADSSDMSPTPDWGQEKSCPQAKMEPSSIAEEDPALAKLSTAQKDPAMIKLVNSVKKRAPVTIAPDEGDDDDEEEEADTEMKSKIRNRNREHAAKSRQRKRAKLANLEESMKKLRRENHKLRQIARLQLPYGVAEDVIARSTRACRAAYTPSQADVAHNLEICQRNIVLVQAQKDDRSIIYACDSFLKLTGYLRNEVVGQPWTMLLGANASEPTLDAFNKALDEGRDCSACLVCYKANGKPFYNHIYAAGLLGSDGEAKLHILVHHHIPMVKPDHFIRQLRRMAIPDSEGPARGPGGIVDFQRKVERGVTRPGMEIETDAFEDEPVTEQSPREYRSIFDSL